MSAVSSASSEGLCRIVSSLQPQSHEYAAAEKVTCPANSSDHVDFTTPVQSHAWLSTDSVG